MEYVILNHVPAPKKPDSTVTGIRFLGAFLGKTKSVSMFVKLQDVISPVVLVPFNSVMTSLSTA